MALAAASRTSVSGSRTRLLGALLLAVAAMAISPIGALAHPLGNFTINHFAGIRIAGDAVSLDIVIDQAEIPTVAERQRIDVDGDGAISTPEMEGERQSVCARLSEALTLTVDGRALDLSVTAAGLSFPVGTAGLATSRTVCEYRATLDRPMAAGTLVQFADHSTPDRIGWREIVVSGDGITIGRDSAPVPSLVSGQPGASDSLAAEAATDPAAGVSRRLTSYPASLLAAPLAMTDIAFSVSPGGPSMDSPCIPDAFPLSTAPSAASRGYGCEPLPDGQQSGVAAAIPGGIGTEISALLLTTELTIPVLILSILTAMGLGAAHALTPGHGKTLMAAYLVGTRGTARHALALGLTVTASHTLGVLVLAGVILALHVVTPESFTHVTGILSGLVVISIGGWLFFRQGLPMIRAYLAVRSEARATRAPHAHDHDHDHGHPDPRPRGADLPHTVGTHDLGDATAHSHGGVAHRHAPPTSAPLTWRSLFALGLFGGLVPSINALIILLATLAVGRAVYGVVLVVAFGAGMAMVLGGIGLGLVYASRWMERAPGSSAFNRIVKWAPAATSIAILAVGVYVTTIAIAGSPVL